MTTITVERYLLFSGENYYPGGGWRDFDGAYETLDEAKERVSLFRRNGNGDNRRNWWHIVDVETCKVVTNGTVFRAEGEK